MYLSIKSGLTPPSSSMMRSVPISLLIIKPLERCIGARFEGAEPAKP